MNRQQWMYMRLAGSALIAVVALHGATTKEWRRMHTVGVILSAIAMLGTELS